MEAFAFQVYRRFLNGETLSDLARDYGIAEDRLEPRIRAAEQYWEQRRQNPAQANGATRARGAGGGGDD